MRAVVWCCAYCVRGALPTGPRAAGAGSALPNREAHCLLHRALRCGVGILQARWCGSADAVAVRATGEAFIACCGTGTGPPCDLGGPQEVCVRLCALVSLVSSRGFSCHRGRAEWIVLIVDRILVTVRAKRRANQSGCCVSAHLWIVCRECAGLDAFYRPNSSASHTPSSSPSRRLLRERIEDEDVVAQHSPKRSPSRGTEGMLHSDADWTRHGDGTAEGDRPSRSGDGDGTGVGRSSRSAVPRTLSIDSFVNPSQRSRVPTHVGAHGALFHHSSRKVISAQRISSNSPSKRRVADAGVWCCAWRGVAELASRTFAKRAWCVGSGCSGRRLERLGPWTRRRSQRSWS